MAEQKDIKIDKIIRSKRKTVMMQITKDAKLVVRAPKYIPNFAIKIAVQKHYIWIEKKLKMMRERAERSKKKQFVNNEEFLYLGRTYRLKIVKDSRTSLVLDKRAGRFLLSSDFFNDEKDAYELFIAWYKKRAREAIMPRVGKFAAKHGLCRYKEIRITGARTRWGSCSGKGNLSFSWRLIMAPEEVVDYVVLHEIAHLKERNHSKQFWSLVESWCPLYKKHKKWLKDNGYLLSL